MDLRASLFDLARPGVAPPLLHQKRVTSAKQSLRASVIGFSYYSLRHSNYRQPVFSLFVVNLTACVLPVKVAPTL